MRKEILRNLYIEQKQSVSQIAKKLKCSQTKIDYWLKKYSIAKRTISQAIYLKSNPNGDPFKIKIPPVQNDSFLYGLGLGLYWGEGTKSNQFSIRLGNTDPILIKKFIDFLVQIYGINVEKLRFGLQIFSDTDPKIAEKFWRDKLSARRSQFMKTIVTPARSLGTYRKKSKHGVLTIYFNNKKLRDILCKALDKIQAM